MRLTRAVGFALLGVMGTGCYTLQPTHGDVPAPGNEIAFDVNDVGRVALGGAMGPEIAQIEGRLVSKEGGDYLVAVTAIHLLRGGEQAWTGEQVRIKPEYVGSSYQRQFSKGRTIVISAVAAAAFVYLATRALVGSGSEDPAPPGGSGTSIRVP
ncbi:MAG: hypothetical protein ABJE47_19985 [bacterium]